jgi:hypothetical protein
MTWDIIDNIFPDVKITETQENPVPARGILSSAISVAVAASCVFVATDRFRVSAQPHVAEASARIEIFTSPRPKPSVPPVRRAVGMEDATSSAPSVKLAGLFAAVFRPAPDEDPLEEDVSSN